MRIFVDMDNVLVNLQKEWLKHLNTYRGVKYKQEKDITNWEIGNFYPTLTQKQLFDCLFDPDFWERVEPVEDAYKYLKLLKDEGNEVYIATASHHNSLPHKLENCLLKHFDFLTSKDIISIMNKSLLMGDVLFDDYHENLRNFRGIKILMDAPYNANCDDKCFHFRVYNWEEFYKIIRELKNIKGE